MEDSKGNLLMEIVNVADSTNKKVISSVIKSKLGIANPTNIKYLPLDNNNIVIIYKQDIVKNKDFLNKTFFSLLGIWEKLKENKQNGVVIFDINGTLNAVSLIDNELKVIYKNMEIELAVLLSLYENFKSKKVAFFYEDSILIEKEFETLSSMLDLPISYFNKVMYEEDFNLEDHLIGFSESFVGNLVEKFKKRKLAKEELENSEENGEPVEVAAEVSTQEMYDKIKVEFIKYRGLIISLIIVLILSGIGYFAYMKYQEEQEIERQRLIQLESQKKVSDDNQSVLITKLNKNTTLMTVFNSVIDKDFSVLKVSNNVIQVITEVPYEQLDKDPNQYMFYKKIKVTDNLFKELIYLNIEPDSLKSLKKEEVLKIKEKEITLSNFIKEGNFKDFIINEDSSKKVSFYKEYKTKSDLMRELNGLENLNTHNIQFNIIKKGLIGFDLYIMFIK